MLREFYPDDGKSLYYVEFSRWNENDKWQWRLFKRQFLYSNEEWKNMERNLFMSNEVHPWQLANGEIVEIEHAVAMETKSFLKFMIDALNEKVERNKK